jgi:hypothetical protein
VTPHGVIPANAGIQLPSPIVDALESRQKKKLDPRFRGDDTSRTVQQRSGGRSPNGNGGRRRRRPPLRRALSAVPPWRGFPVSGSGVAASSFQSLAGHPGGLAALPGMARRALSGPVADPVQRAVMPSLPAPSSRALHPGRSRSARSSPVTARFGSLRGSARGLLHFAIRRFDHDPRVSRGPSRTKTNLYTSICE